MPQPPNLLKKQQEHEEYFKKLKVSYEKVFSSAEGKEVLQDINRSCFSSRSSFSSDAMLMSFNEGKRAVALHINEMAEPSKEQSKRKPKAVI